MICTFFLFLFYFVFVFLFFFFSSRRRHTIFDCDWSSDVCSSDLSTRFFSTAAAATHHDQTSRTQRHQSTLQVCRWDFVRIANRCFDRGVHAGSKSKTHALDRKSTRLNSSHSQTSYAVFCLQKIIGARSCFPPPALISA